jgi:hypothetical protein
MPTTPTPAMHEAPVPEARARWIANATLVQLHNEHSRTNRYLNLPGIEDIAKQFPDSDLAREYAAAEADLLALWTEIRARRVDLSTHEQARAA